VGSFIVRLMIACNTADLVLEYRAVVVRAARVDAQAVGQGRAIRGGRVVGHGRGSSGGSRDGF